MSRSGRPRPWRSRIGSGLAVLAIAGLAGCAPAMADRGGLAPGGVAGGPLERATGVAVVGEADFGWTLRTLSGVLVELEEFRGRVLFINLWATWCGPCRAELASIQALRSSLEGVDVAFLLVSPEEPEPVGRFVRRLGYDLPVLLEHTEIPERFGLTALPTSFVVDRRGRIVLRHRGAADWDDDGVRRFLRFLAGPVEQP